MARAHALLATVDRLYAAAREPEGWMAALESVTDLLSAAHTIIIAGNPFDGGFALGARIDEAAVENALTIRREDVKDGLVLDDLPDGMLVRRNRLIPDRDFVRTQYYNDFVRPLGGFHSFFYRRAIAETGMVLVVCRPPQTKDFDPWHEVMLATLLPHFVNAVDLHRRLRAAERQEGRLVGILDNLACGVVLTDELARPLFMNTPAECLLSEADGLAIGTGGLVAADPHATRRLRQAIADAGTPREFRFHDLSAAAGLHSGGRARLCLRRPSLRPPLMVTVLPIRSFGALAPGAGEPTVALFVDEPGAPLVIDRDALTEAFGLTRREADIAALIGEGHDLATLSPRLGLGLGTARNHLKHVFEKTGVHSQANLVALVRSYREMPL